MAKREVKKAVQSTQKFLPIKDVRDDIIITTDDRYVKILEFKPTAFFMKPTSEQNNIILSFIRFLKIAPNTMQIKVFSTNSDLSEHIYDLSEDLRREKNEQCRIVNREYMKTLSSQEIIGVTRRFFVSFEYERPAIMKKVDFTDIKVWMNNEARHIIAAFDEMGNEYVERRFDNINDKTLEILYQMLNRGGDSFKTRKQNVTDLYRKHYEKNEVAIPPTDIIAPNKINISNSKYVIVDGRYYSYLYIPSSGYNKHVYPGWLNPLIVSYEGVDCDIFFSKVSKEKVIGDIRRNITYSIAEADTSSSVSSSFDKMKSTYQSGEYLRNGLNSGQEFYYMSIILSVSGYSPDEVDNKVAELKKIALQRDVRLKELMFEEEAAFKSTLLLNKLDENLFKKSKRNVLSEGVASTYPFTTYEINDSKGIYLGNNIQNNTLILADLFNRKRVQNSNVFVSGQTGAGKTYALLLLALRMRIKHIPVFILAPEKEHEFRRICTAVGGQFIQIGQGSPNRINIMDIRKQDESSLSTTKYIDGVFEEASYLNRKVASLYTFFSLLLPDISVEEKSVLDQAIRLTYQKKGITANNDSLWKDRDCTEYKEMPIISDLVDSLKTMHNAKRLVTVINYLVMGSGDSFNGQTNVNLDNDFIVFGLQNLTPDTMSLGIFTAMDFCWSKIKEDRTKKKALFIDEWWKMASNTSAAETSLEIAKTIRAYSGAMIVATQQLDDILLTDNGKYGNAVLNSCATKIIMRTPDKDAYTVQDMLNLTNDEVSQLTRFQKGQALLIMGNDKLFVQFVAGKMENDLITTDSNELKAIAERKKAEMEVKTLPKIEDIFVDGDDYIKQYDDEVIKMLDSDEYTDQ